MSQALCFNDVSFEVVDHKNQPWVRAFQIGRALGYANPEAAIPKIYSSHAEEFTPSMTAVVTLPTEGGPQEVRIFSLRGCHLLAMFARTPVAKAFRKWVLDVLDTLQPLPPLALDISTTVERKPLEKLVKVWASQAGMPHAQAWTQVNAHFNLGSITELPTKWLPDAINFVEGKIDALPKALPPSQPATPTYVDRLQLTPWDKVQLGKEAVAIFERGGKVGPRTLECVLLKLRYLDAIQDVRNMGNSLADDINKMRVGVFGKIVQAGNLSGCMTDPVMDIFCDDTYHLRKLAGDFELTAFRALNASICGAKMQGV